MTFMIVASPRTGSSHLTSLLNKRPDILCHGGIFLRRNLFVRWPKEDRPPEVEAELLRLRKKDPHAYLQRVVSTDYGHAHVGFKIFQGHNTPMLKALLADASLKKILLYRGNVLASYSSAETARESGEYTARRDAETDAPKIAFEPVAFERFREKYETFYRFAAARIRDTGQAFHLLHYQDINDPERLAALLSFIGASTDEVTFDSKRVKQNTPDILARFSNPEEVREYLVENDLQHWTREGDTPVCEKFPP